MGKNGQRMRKNPYGVKKYSKPTKKSASIPRSMANKKNDNKNGKTMSKGHLFEGAQAFEAEAADQFLRLVGRFAVPGAH